MFRRYEEIAVRVKERMDQAKSKSIENNRERVNKYYLQKKIGEFKWKQPKSNEYTEHQKRVVRGEIPLENVHTKELISIHLKAQNVGDYELSERFFDLISTRQMEAKERKRERDSKNQYKRIERSNLFEHNNSTALKKWEQAVLMGALDYNDYSIEQLEHILEVVQAENDEFKIILAENLLLYKEDPKAMYIVRDKGEALDMLEELLGLPIRRTETWFC